MKNWTFELSDECRADWAAVHAENQRRELSDDERARGAETLDGFRL